MNISFEHYVSTHCYQEFAHTRTAPFCLFSLCKVTMSDSIHGLLLSVLVSSLRLNTLLSLSPLFCFKSLHSNAAHQPGEEFYFFFQPPRPPPHLGRQRPTGTYLVSVFIPTACLWPTGKLQSVICLLVDRNLPFSSSLAPTLTSKLVTTTCLNLGRGRLSRVACERLCLFCWGHALPSSQKKTVKVTTPLHKRSLDRFHRRYRATTGQPYPLGSLYCSKTVSTTHTSRLKKKLVKRFSVLVETNCNRKSITSLCETNLDTTTPFF